MQVEGVLEAAFEMPLNRSTAHPIRPGHTGSSTGNASRRHGL